jgi:hypothetical protein
MTGGMDPLGGGAVAGSFPIRIGGVVVAGGAIVGAVTTEPDGGRPAAGGCGAVGAGLCGMCGVRGGAGARGAPAECELATTELGPSWCLVRFIKRQRLGTDTLLLPPAAPALWSGVLPQAGDDVREPSAPAVPVAVTIPWPASSTVGL